jgi:hypothetical protein
MVGLLPIKTMAQRARKDWPVPESPLIGRKCQVHCTVGDHYEGWTDYKGPATILRVHGNKRDRMRTPESASPAKLKESVSCTVALHEPDGTLGRSIVLYVSYKDIEGAPYATQD